MKMKLQQAPEVLKKKWYIKNFNKFTNKNYMKSQKNAHNITKLSPNLTVALEKSLNK